MSLLMCPGHHQKMGATLMPSLLRWAPALAALPALRTRCEMKMMPSGCVCLLQSAQCSYTCQDVAQFTNGQASDRTHPKTHTQRLRCV